MAGYDGYSKSNNAVAAEEAGLVVRSKITKAWLTANGIDVAAGFVKFLIRLDFLTYDEWHHTSKMYNRTYYYSADTIAEELAILRRNVNRSGVSFYEVLFNAFKAGETDRHAIHNTFIAGNF